MTQARIVKIDVHCIFRGGWAFGLVYLSFLIVREGMGA